MGRAEPPPDPVPAGSLSVWLGQISASLDHGTASEVPCGECTGCCRAAQFVHVGPDEVDARAVIPPELLFDAPGLPEGHALLGFDARGWCPMLSEAGCTIYDERPRACRVYDCRVFTATGIVPNEAGREAVAARVAAWRFSVTTPDERARWDALRRAAAFVGALPHAAERGSTGVALAALRVHALFLGDDGRDPSVEEVLAALAEPGHLKAT